MAKKNTKVTRKIELMIDGEYKTFHSPFASARNVYKAQDLFKRLDEEENEKEVVEDIIAFLAKDIYQDQFTVDQFWDGIEASDFIEEIQNQLLSVITKDVEQTKDFLAHQQAQAILDSKKKA